MSAESRNVLHGPDGAIEQADIRGLIIDQRDAVNHELHVGAAVFRHEDVREIARVQRVEDVTWPRVQPPPKRPHA